MAGLHTSRLRQGESLKTILSYLIESHPTGLKRSQIQDRLKKELRVGESTGGVNRHMKKLRQMNLVEWDQSKYRYVLPQDYDRKSYFIRLIESFSMTTDQAYFMSLKLKDIISQTTLAQIEDYIGFRYDQEMSENIMELKNGYRKNEILVHDLVTKMICHHNNYVRLRLYKTANECFVKDLSGLSESTVPLASSYSKNLKSIQESLQAERESLFRMRQQLIGCLKEHKLSKRMKFLIRFALNHVRPSLVYDGMI